MSRVVIFSASVGAGHDSAAEALADRLTARGFAVDRHDFLTLMPAGRAVCGSYRRIITHAPALYQCIYSRTERAARPGLVQRHLLRGAEQAVLDAIPPDAVAAVATYPLAAQVLGRLRASGLLAVPVVVTFTDFSVHPLWIAPGVDLYLAPHAVTAEQAVAHGVASSRVAVARPLVSARFTQRTAARRQAARARFGLDAADKPLALLLGGSWGVGDIERTARDLAASGAVTPVVVCGRNEALRGRLRAAGFPHVFGWVGDMPTLMAAADVMVQNAGASSTLEAFATGLPVATYRSLVGHGRTNAAVLDEAGLAVWVRSEAELPGTLRELVSGVRGRRQHNAGLAMVGDGAEADAVIMELLGGAEWGAGAGVGVGLAAGSAGSAGTADLAGLAVGSAGSAGVAGLAAGSGSAVGAAGVVGSADLAGPAVGSAGLSGSADLAGVAVGSAGLAGTAGLVGSAELAGLAVGAAGVVGSTVAAVV